MTLLDPAQLIPYWESLAPQIFCYTAVPDLGTAAALSRAWSKAATNDDVWRDHCQRHWSTKKMTCLTRHLLEDLANAVPPPGFRSWRGSYRAAERTVSSNYVSADELSGASTASGKYPRVWKILHCPPPFESTLEAAFWSSPSFKYTDTGMFRGVFGEYEIFSCESDDDEAQDMYDDDDAPPMLKRCKTYMQLYWMENQLGPCFRAERKSDWGLQLAPDWGRQPLFVATDQVADEAWLQRVMSMPPILVG
eukprot:TRINITY_DN2459_c0_g1_i3.p1 TRINITY_DN2459_c0_g1~~TRINITY_DN2459_c0_g1_i3.p1  ORF type:complete len:250 (-),score=32.24 TRINITY_DN2459_c0_g1_i3:549-1298(-)